MTDAGPEDRRDGATPGADTLAALARDWIALWQSELTAMAQDRECREAWAGLLTLWVGAASAAVDAIQPHTRRDPHGSTRPDVASRPQADPAAPNAGGDALERLHRRIVELEARLAAMEHVRQP
ncbi:MAG: hypothetical protein ACYCZB_07210 [Acidiphilium sp.]